MEEILDKIYQLLTVYGLKVLAALAIFVVGRWVAKGVRKLVERMMTKGKIDPTLVTFTSNMAYIGLLAFIVIAALGQLGIQTTSFIAILGAAGLAVGLALQGSLSNFAAGFLLIIFRPFKVGDLIEAAGVFGVVEAIQIFTTQLKTADNKTVIIPNAKLTDDNIVNWTVKGTRRVDMVFGIGYDDDIDKARSLMAEIIAEDSRILETPAPQISVSELADSSVNFVVRPWVKVEDYWGVHFDLTEKIKKAFDANGVSFPFPQRDVHLYQHGAEVQEKSA
ncbi:mechanosensitive ion channel family protein [Desulfosarcina sp.]|uniref:mechanosensitive ion channel family protein n=1 Tax=Desulfosarcina sp. TaxID=2027861 RepID=UPI0029AA0CEC|nr:mechanosensitive ion channel domain-containing protein [Desulfosarcina sp.]MDX2451667.1 mechanosensitive ion channel [Desulfosarcina sp.]MDX2489457.1 mechanosensitive ion channel [Desulfosarcina sp.]